MSEQESEEPSDEQDAPPDRAAEELAPEQRPAASGKRFRAATDEELDPQSFMLADDRSAVRAVFSGGSILEDRGDADFIGGAIRRLARTLRKSAEAFRQGGDAIGAPLLRRVQFGHSVTVELEISAEEKVRQTMEGARQSPTIDAARALARLLAAEPEDVVPRALRLGADAAAEYKRFLNLLAEGDRVTVEWQTPDASEIVAVTSDAARRDWAILDREGERQTTSLKVPGTLTMADSRRQRFELTLPSELARPPLLKRKQTVEGEYAEEVGQRLKREGLWDSEVEATIEVTYDVPDTTATPRDTAYRLVDAEPLLSTVRLFE